MRSKDKQFGRVTAVQLDVVARCRAGIHTNALTHDERDCLGLKLSHTSVLRAVLGPPRGRQLTESFMKHRHYHCGMTTMPPFRNDVSGRYAPAVQTGQGDPLQNWLEARHISIATKIRGPLVLGAQRIKLAADRCDELQAELSLVRNRLADAPPWADRQIVDRLEDRAAKLASELHAERLSLWADLKPLAEAVADAGVERIRLTWLNELSRLTGGGDGSP